MKIENSNGQKVLTPDSGMYLCNDDIRVIGTIVHLGKEADESDWIEISKERKEELETLWNEEILDENIATDKDYQSALESLGVNFDE